MSESSGEKDNKQRPLSLMTDLYIDFLGSLVPGLFAIILGVSVLVWSCSVFCCTISSYAQTNKPQNLQVPTLEKQLEKWKELGLGPYGNVSLLLVASYVLGSIFYRQDPKKPDYKSAKKIYNDPTLSDEDKARLAVQPTSEKNKLVTEYDAQFPYFFLKEYLEGRGLFHLIRWVPWSGRDNSTWTHRTKMFINILKIRLQYILPERCKDIIRNEAHVRMATSVWYATNFLLVLSVFSLLLVIISYFLIHDSSIFNVAIFDLIVFSFAFYLKSKIEWFTHYLRVREIVYVLETADFADRHGEKIFPEDFIGNK